MNAIYEKIQRADYDTLTDAEVLSTVIRGRSPVQAAERLLARCEGDLRKLASFLPAQLESVSGVGSASAVSVVGALELGKRLARSHADRVKITEPHHVADLLMPRMRYLEKEIVVVLALDTKGGVAAKGYLGADAYSWAERLAEGVIFNGTLNASVFHPREIFKFAILHSANSLILAHNHPSGDPQPSREDIASTKTLVEAGWQLSIEVLDHVIIGDGTFVSLKEEGFMPVKPQSQ